MKRQNAISLFDLIRCVLLPLSIVSVVNSRSMLNLLSNYSPLSGVEKFVGCRNVSMVYLCCFQFVNRFVACVQFEAGDQKTLMARVKSDAREDVAASFR